MTERVLVEDITTLRTGQVIMKNGKTSGHSVVLTVKAPYGRHNNGRFALQDGVLCTAHARGGRSGHDVLLTVAQAEDSIIYLVEPEIGTLTK